MNPHVPAEPLRRLNSPVWTGCHLFLAAANSTCFVAGIRRRDVRPGGCQRRSIAEETQERSLLRVLWAAIRVSFSSFVPVSVGWSMIFYRLVLSKEVLMTKLHSRYRCGRAQRPDAAMKVVFALRKEGITPSSTLSNTYFKAKKVGLILFGSQNFSCQRSISCRRT